MKATDQRQEHTGSYYAASINEVTGYPNLEGAHSADVCVVGAGFTGTATALSRMLKVYPQLRDVEIEYEWGGKIGVVLRRIPGTQWFGNQSIALGMLYYKMKDRLP